MNYKPRNLPSIKLDPHELIQKAQGYIASGSIRMGEAHRGFLDQRLSDLQRLSEALGSQIGTYIGQKPQPATSPALFNRRQMEEFASGSVTRCFGPDFSRFEGKRIPRIPNGDLLFMDRVVAIHGKRGDLRQQAQIQVEYDVPRDAWYWGVGESMPVAILMEIALQPCGFLSAYLGTMMLAPDEDFYFRNLDGEAELVKASDLRGETLTTKAELISTVNSGGTILQRFSFEVTVRGERIYFGKSLFGYFPAGTMQRQVGLDGGEKAPGRFELVKKAAGARIREIVRGISGQDNSKQAHFDEPSSIYVFNPLETEMQDCIYTEKTIDANAWYFKCHFYQDPVIPGSLGVDSAIRALELYGAGGSQGSPFQVSALPGVPMQWKYRGQILPTDRQMSLELEVKQKIKRPNQIDLLANACIWIDRLRIYEIQNLSLRMCTE